MGELIRSKDRVRDLGEVFTPRWVIDDMLDLLPDEMWAPHPSATFLEPACGDGNFLVAILERKLAKVADDYHAGLLPAGVTFHAVEAVASIYGVDISPLNVEGGEGYGPGARSRMIETFDLWHGSLTEQPEPWVAGAVSWIVGRNIIVGDMLADTAAGLLFHEYRFDADLLTVEVAATTLGAILEEAQSGAADTAAVPVMLGLLTCLEDTPA